MSWNYFATRLHGDGTETLTGPELPISGLQFTRQVSGPGGITGTITPEIKRLTADDGKPMFLPYDTAIYAEADGHIRYGAVLTNMTATGQELALTCTGFTAMPNGEPYNGVRSRVQVDPMDEYRHLWDHFQGQQGKDYGLRISTASSPVRIGTKKKDVEFQTGDGENVAFEAGPYKVNFWSTHDIGKKLNELAKGRFDYRTEFSWDDEAINKYVRLDHPRIGRRRVDDRYVVGENVFQTPAIDYRGEDYCSEVIVLGAGEGRKMKRGHATRRTNRMKRTIVIVDDSLDSDKACTEAAVREMRRRMGEAHLEQFTVLTEELTADEGDEILFQNAGGWADDEEVWVRVLAITTAPESPETLLKVGRV